MEVKATIKEKKQTVLIELKLQETAPSKNGKTSLIATSHGSRTTNAFFRGRPVVVAAKAFIYPINKPRKAIKKDFA